MRYIWPRFQEPVGRHLVVLITERVRFVYPKARVGSGGLDVVVLLRPYPCGGFRGLLRWEDARVSAKLNEVLDDVPVACTPVLVIWAQVSVSYYPSPGETRNWERASHEEAQDLDPCKDFTVWRA